MPTATYSRYIGIARELGRSTLSAAVAGGATTLNLNTIQGTFANTAKITIYDGANTEVVTASAIAGQVVTVSATLHPHGAGCLVTTVGTASAGPTDFIPVTKFDPFDNPTRLIDAGWRGAPAAEFDTVDGVRHGEIDISGDVFPDTFGYFASGMLGDVVFTSGTPNTHAISALNSGSQQPTTWQLTDVYLANSSVTTRQYGSCMFSELTTKFTAEGMLSYDTKALSYASGTVSKPTASFSSVVPLPAFTGIATIGGTVTPLIVDGTVSIKRSVNPIPNLSGSPNPYLVWGGPLTVDGNLAYIAEDETALNYTLNVTKPSVDLNFSTGSGASLLGVKFHMNKCDHDTTKPDASKDQMMFASTFKGLPNTTDAGASGGYSQIKVTLSNTKPTATYG